MKSEKGTRGGAKFLGFWRFLVQKSPRKGDFWRLIFTCVILLFDFMILGFFCLEFRDSHREIRGSRKIAYTAIFRPRNLGLHAPDFEGRNVPYTGAFREFKVWILIQNFSEWLRNFLSRNMSYMGTFRSIARAKRREKFRTCEILRARASLAEMCPCRTHFGSKFEAKLQIFETRSKMLRVSNSGFRIFEILTKLKQNWCINGAQFRQLCSIFEFFETSKFRNWMP